MPQIRIEQGGLTFLPAKARCLCGKCDHKVLRVLFDDGNEWFPTNKEFVALKKMISEVVTYNMNNDQYCFKKEQEVPVSEVLENGC